MVQITDRDIARVERYLLPEGAVFNEERRVFIKCMESRDVAACPGSGKTTALLAKLLILALKMPFPDGHGICVLTHTNVAIDKIIKRAGSSADILFRHPNFFGTIQSFVDKFLAIPAYRTEFKKSIVSIDQDLFYSVIENDYRKTKTLHGWLEPRGGAGTLSSYWFHPSDLSIGKDLNNDIPKLSKTTPTYQGIHSIRKKILSHGILCYHDAYSLALRYLHYYPEVSYAFQSRFRYVFIDEMQDTDSHQLRVLKLVFDPQKVIMQCLGDSNQAIYYSDVHQDMFWVPNGNPPLHFSDTIRYGESIARLLDTVRVDRQLLLRSNQQRISLQPHLITYREGQEENVLPAYSKLLLEHNLHNLTGSIFKAVGWIGKDKTEEGKLCLRHYLPAYQKSLQNQKQHFSNLLSYLNTLTSVEVKVEQARLYLMSIVGGIVHAIGIVGQKNPKSGRRFISHTYLGYLCENDKEQYCVLLRNLSEWILNHRHGNTSPMNLRDKVARFIRESLIPNETAEISHFLDSDEVDFQILADKASNTYISGYGIEIKVGTVHPVKGETHTATLYLDTFYRNLDSTRLLPFFKGTYPTSESKKTRHIQNLKIAHVALSRPTHLAAFACSKAIIAGHEAALVDNGWIIKEVHDILGIEG